MKKLSKIKLLIISCLIFIPATVFAAFEIFAYLQGAELYQTGSEPLDIITADINNDGFADILTANRLGRSISLFFSNGDGSFVRGEPLNVPGGATSLAAQDMNSDGAIDIITSYCAENDKDNGIIIFNGDGKGNFIPGISHGFDGTPYNVLSANFNNDLIPDLAASDYPNAEIIVLLSNSSGGYDTLKLPTGRAPIALLNADLNHDGYLDLISSDHLSGSSSVYLGRQEGGFGVRKIVPTGELPYAISLADINNDKILDLLVAHSSASGYLQILFGNGDGTFHTSQTIPTKDRLIFVGSADFNHDGFLDVITTANEQRFANIYINNGQGVLLEEAHLVSAQNKIYSLAIADFNQDALPDLATIEFEQGVLAVALGKDM